MNMNVYKSNNNNINQQNIKESISFSKINAKIKKRTMNNMGGLQQSCNTNPSRGATGSTTQQESLGSQPIFQKEKEREGSTDGTSQYNVGSIRA